MHTPQLTAIAFEDSGRKEIIKGGKKDQGLVKNLGFYGACVPMLNQRSIKVINGSFRNWASMGIDLVYPLDLRSKQVVLMVIRGKQGGEKLELTFRDKFARSFDPQLALKPQGPTISDKWQQLRVTLGQHYPGIDLTQVVHLGVEIGSSTVQNPAQATLFIQDIVVEPR